MYSVPEFYGQVVTGLPQVSSLESHPDLPLVRNAEAKTIESRYGDKRVVRYRTHLAALTMDQRTALPVCCSWSRPMP
jgi:hypothetical protein